MMKFFNSFSKITGFVLQAILVVLAVLIFSYFDPFNILSSHKKTLQDTPITVGSVREIGQMITAEYYGEVLSSLKETYIEEIQAHVNSFKRFDTLFKIRARQFREEELDTKRKNKIAEYFKENYRDLTQDSLYPYYLEYLEEVFRKRRKIPFLAFMGENKVIEELKTTDYWKEPFDNAAFEKIKDKKKFDDYLAPNKRELKKQIVLLGRGWVRAGYDFENFSKENFMYDSLHGNIYFLGLEPKILYCDINPWFNPEKKIKGFELILYTGRANKAEYLQMAKQECLDKLRANAMKCDILSKAQKNAEDNFKELFSLILGKEINNVFFMKNNVAVFEKMLYTDKDSIIDGSMLSIIDTLKESLSTPQEDSLTRQQLIKGLKGKKVRFRNMNVPLSLYTATFYDILDDYTVDSLEYKKLKTMGDQIGTKSDSLTKKWYGIQGSDLNAEKKDFNAMVDALVKNTDQVISKGKSVKNKPKQMQLLNALKK